MLFLSSWVVVDFVVIVENTLLLLLRRLLRLLGVEKSVGMVTENGVGVVVAGGLIKDFDLEISWWT